MSSSIIAPNVAQAIDSGYSNLINAMAANSPVIMVFTMFVISLCNSSPAKGGFYLGWILLITLLRSLAPSTITKAKTCNMETGLKGDDSTFGLYIMTFSMLYICTPMFILNSINWYLFAFFISYIVFDIGLKFSKKCFDTMTSNVIFLNFLCGALLGTGASAIMYYVAKDYSYVTESSSDTETCKVANKKTFKCKVFKNGELINTVAAN